MSPTADRIGDDADRALRRGRLATGAHEPPAPTVRGRPAHLRRTAAAGVAAVAVTIAITLSGSSSGPQAAARAAMVGIPIAVGLYAMRACGVGAVRPPAGPRRLRLVPATLSGSPDPWLYSFGRVAGWTVEVVARLPDPGLPDRPAAGRVDRILVARDRALIVVALYLPTAVLVEQYPLPSPWTDCGDSCPATRSCSPRPSPP